jgi:hypothetical protein
MNQNDQERYFRRTGHPWSADYRLFKIEMRGPKLGKRTLLLLAFAFAATTLVLFLQR